MLQRKTSFCACALFAFVCLPAISAVAQVASSSNYALEITVFDSTGATASASNAAVLGVTAQAAIIGLGEASSYTTAYGFIPCFRGLLDAQAAIDCHCADQDKNRRIDLTELLRLIQFYNSGGFHCASAPGETEDGYVPGVESTAQECTAHDSDYAPLDWDINLTELLRLIQFFNSGGYYVCIEQSTEDGYCPGVE